MRWHEIDIKAGLRRYRLIISGCVISVRHYYEIFPCVMVEAIEAATNVLPGICRLR